MAARYGGPAPADPPRHPQDTAALEGSLRLLPLPWMTAALRLPRGRLGCPRCSRKLGSFSWLPGEPVERGGVGGSGTGALGS